MYNVIDYSDRLYEEYGVRIVPYSTYIMDINLHDYDWFVSDIVDRVLNQTAGSLKWRHEKPDLALQLCKDRPQYKLLNLEDIYEEGRMTGTYLDSYKDELVSYQNKNKQLYNNWMRLIDDVAV